MSIDGAVGPAPSAAGGLAASDGPLYRSHDCVLLDLDGTVYVGSQPVPGAREVVAALVELGVRCLYLTNNASRTSAAAAAALRGMGLDVTAEDVVTSAQAAAAMLARDLPAGSPVLVVGGAGLLEALTDARLVPVRSLDEGPRAVVQGFAPTVGWADLAEAAYAVHAGLPWVATNVDLSIPTARGIAPGNGSLVGAVTAATGVTPRVAGKPERALVDAALARADCRRPLMVGDRLDTDIACAVRAGLPSLAVLTGVTDVRRLLGARPGERPTYVSGDLGGVLEAHPPVTRTGDGARVCGAWLARVDQGALDVEEVPQPGREPGSGSSWDALRAACAAGWDADEDAVDADDALRVLANVLPVVDGSSARAAALGSGGSGDSVRAGTGASAGPARSPRP